MSAKHELYWGDFHCHLEDMDHVAMFVDEARRNLDFYPVLCYPFLVQKKKGLRIETVRQRPEFLSWWKKLQEEVIRFHKPGKFVTFLGYEWHGNRTRYGDHNVFYYDDGGKLDDSWELKDLFRNLRKTKAIAIPHHTGFAPGCRGKDWNVHDENLSPFMEVYSRHGCSEGTDTPLPLRNNGSMGPRTTGGTWQDGLNRGYRLGCVASPDGPGLAGRWGNGAAAVWAEDLSRESLWEAVMARRTYGVTGDRIRLQFSANGQPMGAVLPKTSKAEFKVRLEGLHGVDRVELIRNGKVFDTHGHAGKWSAPRGSSRFKVRIECGWGPATYYGFPSDISKWNMKIQVEKGRLLSQRSCFHSIGQRVLEADDRSCRWSLRLPYRTTGDKWLEFCESMVFEIQDTPDTVLKIMADGNTFRLRARDMFEGSHVFRLIGESYRRIQRVFGLRKAEISNPDPVDFNARKIKVHLAQPEDAYKLDVKFKDTKVPRGRNYYYARVTQTNGQMAWSSPIWIQG